MKRFLLKNTLVLLGLIIGFNCAYAEDDATTTEIPEAANIAALKKMESGEYKLMLNNAQVTYYAPSYFGATIYLEDETGGIQVRTEEMGMDPFISIFTKEGETFNGYIYCYYDNFNTGVKTINSTDNTTTDTFTKTETEVVPTELTIEQACNVDNLFRRIKLSRVTVTYDPEMENGSVPPFFLRQFKSAINLYDMMGEPVLLKLDDDYNYTLGIEYVDSLVGYVMVYEEPDEESKTPAVLSFCPIAAKEAVLNPAPVAVDNIAALNDVEDGTVVALTLDSTVITQNNYMSMTGYMQDKTGAFLFDGTIKNSIIDEENVALTGKLIGTLTTDYQQNRVIAFSDDCTDFSYYSSVDSVVAATPTTIAEINSDGASMLYMYYSLKDVTLTYDEDEDLYYLNDGENKIELYDRFYVFMDQMTGDNLLSDIAKFESICGFVAPGWEENTYLFNPYGEDSYKAQEKPTLEIASIAELKALPSDTKVKLALNNLQIIAIESLKYGGDDIYVGDESGAIMLSDEIPYLLSEAGGQGGGAMPLAETYEDESSESVNPFGKAGNVLTGYLYCTYQDYGVSMIVGSGKTAESEISVTEGTVTPKETTIDKIDIATDEFRLVKLSNVKLKKDADGLLVLTDGDNEITVYDEYKKTTELQNKLDGEDDDNSGIAGQSEDTSEEGADNAETTAPEYLYITSATGIIKSRTVYDDDYKESEITVLVPVGENPFVEGEDPSTGIKAVSSDAQNDGDVYSINGVKVRKAGESLKGLSKGLYIVNGKKIVIK